VREVEPAAWDGLQLDAYYRRAYVESACVLEPGEPLLLEHDGTVFAAIRRREPVDVITPYGYGGPAGDDLAAFWPAYDEWAREQGVVTTFIRFHPLYANQRGVPFYVEELAPTIGWRLDGDLPAGMHGKHRNALRKAQSAAEVVAADDLDAFVPLYEETMRRAGAADFYFFSRAYWEALERTARSSRALSASRRRHGCTTTSARPPRRAGSSVRRHSFSARQGCGRRNAATSGSTSAAASAAIATRCTSSSVASTRPASARPQSASSSTTPTHTVRSAATPPT
jgi:hypothetical protein